MQDRTGTAHARHQAGEARDLQATLYRDIGISAVAAALQSINKPEPEQSPDMLTAPRRLAGRVVRAA